MNVTLTDHAALAKCECGCGQTTDLAQRTDTRRGWIKGQPKRFLLGHSGGRAATPDYRVDDRSGCWLWLKALTPSGHANSAGQMAHRTYYERFKGPIPDGYEIDHLCRVRHCVNPAHLEAVTPSENQRRSLNARLTPDAVRLIRLLAADGASYTQIAEEIGISAAHVGSIVRRERWADVGDESTVAEQRATTAALLGRTIGWIERAAVCVSGALDLRFDADDQVGGQRLAIEGVLAMLQQQRETLIDEQAAMAESYAESLRRAEGQA